MKKTGSWVYRLQRVWYNTWTHSKQKQWRNDKNEEHVSCLIIVIIYVSKINREVRKWIDTLKKNNTLYIVIGTNGIYPIMCSNSNWEWFKHLISIAFMQRSPYYNRLKSFMAAYFLKDVLAPSPEFVYDINYIYARTNRIFTS